MSVGSTAELGEAAAATASLSHARVRRLRDQLSSLPKSVEYGDESLVSELVSFLDSISDAALSDPGNEDAQIDAFEAVVEIHRFFSSPLASQAVIDALSFELPKAVSKFAALSDRCLEVADCVIDSLISTCNPRDMLSILCEALDSLRRMINASGYVAPLLSGLSKVLISIKKRHFQQAKVAIHVILSVLKAVCLELGEQHTDCINLFGRALSTGDSIRVISAKFEGRENEKLRALLGLYVLQIMALLSLSVGHEISSCLPLMSRLSNFLPYCGLSYIGLLTGSDVDRMTNMVVAEHTEDEHDFMNCLSYIKHGASLSVIWGLISDGVAQAAMENIAAVKYELQSNQTSRWQSLAMLKHILSSVNMPWELKTHVVDFLLCIASGNIAKNCSDEHADGSIYMPSLCTALQAISEVVIFAPNPVLRKNAFEALKRMLADVPAPHKLDMVNALITRTNSPSMIAILLDLVRGELHRQNCQAISVCEDDALQDENNSNFSLWNAGVLELLELVLRPPKGGPPSFPEHVDSVSATLNLYRFILITESAGKTNYTGVLSKNNLLKAYNEWLLPLRTLLTGIIAENKNDSNQLAVEIECALYPVVIVLYRCIELVEEKLRHVT